MMKSIALFASALLIGAGEASLRGAEDVAALADPTYVSVSPGEPFYGSVTQGGWVYVKSSISMTKLPVITIDLVPFSGDPDLFATTDGSQPTVSSPFSSFGISTETVRISPSSSHYCNTSSQVCDVHVGISGFTDATFLLWISTTDSVNELSNGVPLDEIVSPAHLNFFKFYVTQNAPVEFQVSVQPAATVTSVDVALYASTQTTAPSSSNYQWTSVGGPYSYGRIEITNPPLTNGYYYVSAYDLASVPVAYTLLATNGVPFSRLLLGALQEGHVSQRQYNMYYLDTKPDMKSLNFTLACPQGDGDLYITADGSTPSQSNFQWRSAAFGSDYITILGDDPTWKSHCSNGAACDLHVSVYGFQETTYGLTVNEVTTSPDLRRLSAGLKDE